MSVVQVQVQPAAGWPVVALTGEVDLSNVDDLTRAVEAAVDNAALGLVLDLSGVTYLDSTGLRLLYQLARELRDRQQQLRLVVPDDALIWPVLRLGGVPSLVEVSAAAPRAADPGPVPS